MARIKFRQFEQELQPGQQVYDVPAFQDVPAPENKISDVLLSENVSLQKLGETITDIGTTAGKIVASEQTRLRKKQWDVSAPSVMSRLNLEVDERLRSDYEAGMTGEQVETEWPNFVSGLMMKFRTDPDVTSVHEEDRPKLLALLRAQLESSQIKAIKQFYSLDNEVQSSRVLRSVQLELNKQLRYIRSPEFNTENDGQGHEIPASHFIPKFVTGFADSIIKQALDKEGIKSDRQRERITLEARRLYVEGFKTDAIGHNNRIKNGFAALEFGKTIEDALQTAALQDPGTRRRFDEDDERLLQLEEYILPRAISSGIIDPEDVVPILNQAQRTIDLNDVETDIRDNPELAMMRLETKPITVEDKIKFFKEHEIELNDKGEFTKLRKPDNYARVKAEWEELESNTGGFYPSIIGGQRQGFINKAIKEHEEKSKADLELVFKTLDDNAKQLLDPELPNSEVERILHPNTVEQYRGKRNVKGWKLDQYPALYQYMMLIRKDAGDLTSLSNTQLKELEERLHPSKQGLNLDDPGRFKKPVMEKAYGALLATTSAIRKRRAKDQADIGVDKAIKAQQNIMSEEGLKTIITDQLIYKGLFDLNSKEPQTFPTPMQLAQEVSQGKLSIWSKKIAEAEENTWKGLTETGSGLQKQAYIEKKIAEYGEYAPVVLQQMFRMDGFSRADQLYTVIDDETLLNNLNQAQKNAKANRGNVKIIFDDDYESYEELRTEIGTEKEFQDFLLTYHRNGQDRDALLDLYTDYALWLKTENMSKGNVIDDPKKASVYLHLIKDQYEVIDGGKGSNVKVRIPLGELEGRNKDNANNGLEQFTKALLQERKDNEAWNWVRKEDESSFLGISTGDDLYQWKTNSDESGLTLLFYNERLGAHVPATYNGRTATLTWKMLREITDVAEPSALSFRGIIEGYENWQKDKAEQIQRTAEEMDIGNTPLPLREEKEKDIAERRKVREQKRKEEEGITVTDIARRTTYEELDLPKKEIDKLMKMDTLEAEKHLIKLGK